MGDTKCPGCGRPLKPQLDGSLECWSGKHPGERKGARVYWRGRNGRLRPGSAHAHPKARAKEMGLDAGEE